MCQAQLPAPHQPPALLWVQARSPPPNSAAALGPALHPSLLRLWLHSPHISRSAALPLPHGAQPRTLHHAGPGPRAHAHVWCCCHAWPRPAAPAMPGLGQLPSHSRPMPTAPITPGLGPSLLPRRAQAHACCPCRTGPRPPAPADSTCTSTKTFVCIWALKVEWAASIWWKVQELLGFQNSGTY